MDRTHRGIGQPNSLAQSSLNALRVEAASRIRGLVKPLGVIALAVAASALSGCVDEPYARVNTGYNQGGYDGTANNVTSMQTIEQGQAQQNGQDPNSALQVGGAAGAQGELLPGAQAVNGQVVSGPANGDVSVNTDGTNNVVMVGAESGSYEDTDPSALSDFRPHLDPYGTWAQDSNYGTVWVPNRAVVGEDFAPYVSSGHWVYDTDYTWVSDYSWGWAPFHYGRWVYLGTSWGWIPGRRYAPAWVSWRTGPSNYGYVGWAPMQPNWYWNNGYAVGLSHSPPAPYVFCSSRDVFQPSIGGRIVHGEQVAVIGRGTTPYVPARTAAQPTVNDRTGARPTVNGGGLGGPAPSSLGFASRDIPHPAAGSAASSSMARAVAFSNPKTAVPLGASAPAMGYGRAGSSAQARLGETHTLRGASVVTGANSGPSMPVFRRPDSVGSVANGSASSPSYSRPQAPSVAPTSGSYTSRVEPRYSAPQYVQPASRPSVSSSPPVTYSRPSYSGSSSSSSSSYSSHPYQPSAPVSRPSTSTSSSSTHSTSTSHVSGRRR